MIKVLARVEVDSSVIKNLFFNNINLYDVHGEHDDIKFDLKSEHCKDEKSFKIDNIDYLYGLRLVTIKDGLIFGDLLLTPDEMEFVKLKLFL